MNKTKTEKSWAEMNDEDSKIENDDGFVEQKPKTRRPRKVSEEKNKKVTKKEEEEIVKLPPIKEEISNKEIKKDAYEQKQSTDFDRFTFDCATKMCIASALLSRSILDERIKKFKEKEKDKEHKYYRYTLCYNDEQNAIYIGDYLYYRTDLYKKRFVNEKVTEYYEKIGYNSVKIFVGDNRRVTLSIPIN